MQSVPYWISLKFKVNTRDLPFHIKILFFSLREMYIVFDQISHYMKNKIFLYIVSSQ